jgi:hypothetical protein
MNYLGMCVPSVCNVSDIFELLRIGRFLIHQLWNVDLNTSNTIITCQTDNDRRLNLKDGHIMVIIVMTCLTFLVISGTIIDIYREHRRQSRSLPRTVSSLHMEVESLLLTYKSGSAIKQSLKQMSVIYNFVSITRNLL